jgi:hypothetical protein
MLATPLAEILKLLEQHSWSPYFFVKDLNKYVGPLCVGYDLKKKAYDDQYVTTFHSRSLGEFAEHASCLRADLARLVQKTCSEFERAVLECLIAFCDLVEKGSVPYGPLFITCWWHKLTFKQKPGKNGDMQVVVEECIDVAKRDVMVVEMVRNGLRSLHTYAC